MAVVQGLSLAIVGSRAHILCSQLAEDTPLAVCHPIALRSALLSTAGVTAFLYIYSRQCRRLFTHADAIAAQ